MLQVIETGLASFPSFPCTSSVSSRNDRLSRFHSNSYVRPSFISERVFPLRTLHYSFLLSYQASHRRSLDSNSNPLPTWLIPEPPPSLPRIPRFCPRFHLLEPPGDFPCHPGVRLGYPFCDCRLNKYSMSASAAPSGFPFAQYLP